MKILKQFLWASSVGSSLEVEKIWAISRRQSRILLGSIHESVHGKCLKEAIPWWFFQLLWQFTGNSAIEVFEEIHHPVFGRIPGTTAGRTFKATLRRTPAATLGIISDFFFNS